MILKEQDNGLLDLSAFVMPSDGPALSVDMQAPFAPTGFGAPPFLAPPGKNNREPTSWSQRDPILAAGAKRTMDIVGATALLVAFLPLIIVIFAVLLVTDGSPALFSQMRVGRNGKMFRCYKFRTMVRDAGERLQRHLETNEAARLEWEACQKLRNDPRVNRLGRILRISSLDELPQLWNILRGDMSLVGPRPIVSDEIVRYGDKFALYSSVRPGLTGLWQVNGRSDTSYDERVAMDARYARERSLVLDVMILLKTAKVAWSGRGSC